MFDVDEAAIYDAVEKRSEVRVALGLDYPVFSASYIRAWNINVGLPKELRYWMASTPAPVFDAGLLIREYGLPPWETMISRPGLLPLDDRAFRVRLDVTFPQTGPNYGWSQQIVLGSLGGGRGKLTDAFRLVYEGDDAGTPGEVSIRSGAFGEIHSFTNDGASHRYDVYYHPDAAGTPGDEVLTIKLDTVTVFEASPGPSVAWPAKFDQTEPVIVRPWFIQIGTPTIPRPAVTPLGSLDAPATMINVTRIEVAEDGDGYDTRSYPAWSSANAGTDYLTDGAAIGERVWMHGETWAYMPNVVGAEVASGREGEHDTFVVRLSGGETDGDVNIFKGTRFARRPIIIDSRTVSGASASAWRRQFVGMVEDVQTQQGDNGTVEIVLSGRDLISARLDSNMLRAYALADSEAGSIDAENEGYTMGWIVTDLCEVADNLWGADVYNDIYLGMLQHRISLPIVLPQMDTGDGTMLTAINSIAEELGLEIWRRYAAEKAWDVPVGLYEIDSGGREGRFGELMVGVWNVGTGTPTYTFRGRGHVASEPENVKGATVSGSIVDSPGQVAPEVDGFGVQASLLSGGDIGPGHYPTAPFPPDLPEMGVSISGGGVGLSLLSAATARDVLDAIGPYNPQAGFVPGGSTTGDAFEQMAFHPGGEFVAMWHRNPTGEGGATGVRVFEYDPITHEVGALADEYLATRPSLSSDMILSWHPDGDYLAIELAASPWIRVLPFDVGTGTFGAPVADPASNPGSLVEQCAFSPDGNWLAAVSDGVAPGLHVWAWAGAFGAKQSDPVGYAAIASGTMRVTWHPDTTAIAVTFSPVSSAGVTCNVRAWAWSGAGFGSMYPSPETALGNESEIGSPDLNHLQWHAIDWHPGGRYLAVGNDATTNPAPYAVVSFEDGVGFGDVRFPPYPYHFYYAYPTSLWWSPDGRYLAMAGASGVNWPSPFDFLVVEFTGEIQSGGDSRFERPLWPKDGIWWAPADFIAWHPSGEAILAGQSGWFLSSHPFTPPPERQGGPGKWRWEREAAARSRLRLSAEHHDWIEPSDEIGFDAPDVYTAGDPATWVVSVVRKAWGSDGSMTVDVEAVTADVLGATVRSA